MDTKCWRKNTERQGELFLDKCAQELISPSKIPHAWPGMEVRPLPLDTGEYALKKPHEKLRHFVYCQCKIS